MRIMMAFTGGMGVSSFHGGGVVGAGGTMRMVSPLAFIGAPRFHSGGIAGLKSDEVPTILQSGEGVLSRAQMKAVGGGGNVKVTIENRGTPIAAQDAQVSFDPEGMVVKIITDDARRGGPISGSLARTFNLKRSGG